MNEIASTVFLSCQNMDESFDNEYRGKLQLSQNTPRDEDKLRELLKVNERKGQILGLNV